MLKPITATVLSLSIFTSSTPAFADRGHWGHGRGGGHHHHHRDMVVHRVPPGYASLTIAGLSLLYAAGMFYRHTPAGYVIVTPPVGAVVPALPPSYTTVVVNNVPYYYYGYTYYTTAPGGYVVATPPAAAPLPQVFMPPVSVAAAPVAAPVAAAPVPAAPVLAPPQSAPPQAALYASEKDVNANRDIYDIFIPNGNGSFTSVSLRKTEKGFMGPQGEFYEDHPTIEQLKERYTKK